MANGLQDLMKEMEIDGDRVAMSLDTLASVLVTCIKAGRGSDPTEAAPPAMDSALRAEANRLLKDRFPDWGRLHGQPRAEPRAPTERERQFPDAHRLRGGY